MTAKIGFAQALQHAQESLGQFKEINQTVRKTPYIGHDAFPLYHKISDLRTNLQSISREEFTESQKKQFTTVISKCIEIYRETRSILVQVQKETAQALYNDMIT